MAVQKEIWQRTIIEGLFADNLFLSKAVNDDVYVNEGKTVHIPNAGSPSGVVLNRDSFPATVYARTDQDVNYTLGELTTNPVKIPYADQVELSYNKRNSVIDQDRKALIEAAAEAMLGNWCPDADHRVVTTGGGVSAWTPSATGLRKKITPADVAALQLRFNADNVPLTDRYLLLDAASWACSMASRSWSAPPSSASPLTAPTRPRAPTAQRPTRPPASPGSASPFPAPSVR